MGIGKNVAGVAVSSHESTYDHDLLHDNHKTTANITYYVRSTGDDSNDGLTEGNALATIQAAINKLPRLILHNAVIDVGEGTFGEFRMSHYITGRYPNGSFILRGTMGAPTLTTGTTSGTKTGGSGRTFTDSAQSWTTDELKGMFLDLSGDYRVIKSNTSDTLTLVGSAPGGTSYNIVEPKTIVDVTSPPPNVLHGCKGDSGSANAGFQLKDMRIVTNTFYGIIGFLECTAVRLDHMQFAGAGITNYGSIHLQESTLVYLTDCYFENTSLALQNNLSVGDVDRAFIDGGTANSHGIYMVGTTGLANFGEIHIKDVDRHGLDIHSCGRVDLDVCDINGCGGWGISLDNNDPDDSWVIGGQNLSTRTRLGARSDGPFDISNNTLGGIRARNRSIVELTTCTGTGNGGEGIRLEDGSIAKVSSATTITGTNGDFTLNGGNNYMSYSTYLASDGDSVVNLDDSSYIERRD